MVLVTDKYQVEDIPFDKGSYSTIFKGKEKSTGRAVVIKRIPIDKEGFLFVEREILAHKLLHHDNIVELFDYYCISLDCISSVYLIFDYIRGPNLFDFINITYPITFNRLKKIFTQLIDAVEFIHKNKIAHRDIKLENILINEETNHIYLIDFGLCLIPEGYKRPREKVGSKTYCAPEVFNPRDHCPFKADIWSIGVVLYALVFFDFPKIKNNKLHIKKKHLNNKLLANLLDLLELILCVNPFRRISIPMMRKHAWLK